ncbi:uncharacterized protein LOC122756547 [Drosophila santomea]|uniref:uncharacterized protein LOC122756547 n=1 Tax=Drosophila santomea TaxID=129105 RepID=UPI001CCD9AE6|nr:uncharacterized protein LOC122756547 [Drosophila santomea]
MPRSRIKRAARKRYADAVESDAGHESGCDSTSEVGSPTPTSNSENNLLTILESQNRHFSELLKQVQNSQRDPKNSSAVVLPRFGPERSGSDAQSWCSTVDYVFSENQLDGSALVMTLSKSLEGSASHWLSQTCFPGITWTQFRELFLQHFAGTETLAAAVVNLLQGCPTEGECLSLYGSRMVTSLMARWRSLSVEQIAVSVALAHAAGIDRRLRRLVFATNIDTRSELQQELEAYSFDAGPSQHSNNASAPPGKRAKLCSHIKCHNCGGAGHKGAECRSKPVAVCTQQPGQQRPGYMGGRDRSSVTCYKCGKDGHVSTVCPDRQERSSSNGTHIVKEVSICTVLEPVGTVSQSGESFQFCFDSGAECSLIKEAASQRLSGTGIGSVVILKGIGVLNDYIKYDALIGRDVLSQGIGVTITSKALTMFNEKSILPIEVSECNPDLANVDTDVHGSDRDQLLSILQEYSGSFIGGIPQSRVSTGQLEIRLIDQNKTVQRRPYRLSVDEKAKVRHLIQQLLESNIIRPGYSPFASPMLLVRKKNGTDRLCVDYRELNANAVSEKYPLPLISDQIAGLSGARFFSCIDMAGGFHQIPIHPNSIERTAFVTPEGQFEYLAMPFGLKNAPAVFQGAINRALGDLTHSYAIVYMDDVMMVAHTKEEALDGLRVVLQTLTQAGFSFNIEKCSFLESCVEYLGFEVREGEIRPNPRKIQALVGLPLPRSITQLRQFIGLASYFRQFVPKFSQLLKPLYALTSGSKPFVWELEHERVRQRVISVLANEPVLTIFDPQFDIELHTDAGADGCGAVLLHRIEKKPRVIECFSKMTSSAESRYHSYELETLAKIELRLIATGASRANGQVERVMSALKSMLTAVETGQGSWQDSLCEIQLALDSTPNRVAKVSPLEMLIGREARPFGLTPIINSENAVDVEKVREMAKRDMEKNAKIDKEGFDRNKATVVRHKVGDRVLLRNEERHQTKLDPRFGGPFLVSEVLPGDRCMPEKGITTELEDEGAEKDAVNQASEGCDEDQASEGWDLEID